MITVALIGADGSGKSTIARRLLRESDLPIKYIYMGINLQWTDHLLPTTRLYFLLRRVLGKDMFHGGPPDPAKIQTPPRSLRKRIAGGTKSLFRLAFMLSEEWYRLVLTWYFTKRGFVVLFDRHYFFDYFESDIAPTAGRRPLARRIHGALLKGIYPRPGLVICLDAPAEVLYRRKQEGTIELLEARRKEYLKFQSWVQPFHVVNAEQSEEKVMAEVTGIISAYCRKTHSTASDPSTAHIKS